MVVLGNMHVHASNSGGCDAGAELCVRGELMKENSEKTVGPDEPETAGFLGYLVGGPGVGPRCHLGDAQCAVESESTKVLRTIHFSQPLGGAPAARSWLLEALNPPKDLVMHAHNPHPYPSKRWTR